MHKNKRVNKEFSLKVCLTQFYLTVQVLSTSLGLNLALLVVLGLCFKMGLDRKRGLLRIVSYFQCLKQVYTQLNAGGTPRLSGT